MQSITVKKDGIGIASVEVEQINGNVIVMNVDCNGTVASPNAEIQPGRLDRETVAVLKYIDASNDTVQLAGFPPACGMVLQLLAEGGTVHIKLSMGTFFDGSTSYSFSDNLRLMSVRSSNYPYGPYWAKVS